MTLPASGTISILNIYNEAQLSASSPWYNKGFGLGAYRGLQWWQDNTATGYFSSGAISMSDFYSKRSTTPVTPGSQVFTSNGTFTVPLYSTLTIVTRGGGGGGAGGSGNSFNGTNGNPGGTSSFGGFNSAPGGSGGIIGQNNASAPAGAGSDGTPAGGDGGAANGPGSQGGKGGAGGKTTTVLVNPISGGSGPSVGSSVSVTRGTGGSGGGGGSGIVFFPGNPNPFPYTCSPGNSGGNGYIEVYWS